MVHENNTHARGNVLVLDGNHRVCSYTLGYTHYYQVLAMMEILSEENPDEDTIFVQNQIRQGIRAIMLHPLTPERVLTRLSAGKL